MVNLNLGEINITKEQKLPWRNQSTANLSVKDAFFKNSEVSQLGAGRPRFQNAVKVTDKFQPEEDTRATSTSNLYKSVPARVRSIRKEDDSILKKPKNFDDEYDEQMMIE